MPYSSVSEAPANIRKLDDASLTLAQVNWIANVADGLDPDEVENVWAVAIAQFKRSFVKKGDGWVKREEGVKQDEVHAHGEHDCYCPECGYETEVPENARCNQLECPKCGTRLRARQTGERREEGKEMSVSGSFRSFFKWLLGDDDEFGEWTPAVLKDKKDQNFKDEKDLSLNDIQNLIQVRLNPSSVSEMPVREENAWIQSIFPDTKTGYAIIEKRGQLYRADYSINDNGEMELSDAKEVEVTYQAKALEGLGVGIKVFDIEGEPHWAAMTTNAFMDLEDEAFETKVLEDYVAAVDTGEVPALFLERLEERGLPTNPHGELWYAHVPYSRIGEPVWKGMHEHFLLEIGKFDDTPYAQAMVKALREHGKDCRMSHGYLHEATDREDGVYSRPIWSYERSVLPPGIWPANPWTSFQVFEEVKEMDDKRRAALVGLIGDEQAEALLKAAETKAEELKAAGISFKELDEPETEPEVTPEKVDEEPEADKEAAFVLQKNGEAMKLIVEGVAEALGLEELRTATKEATETAADLAKQVKAIQDADRPWVVLDKESWNRPSQSKDNVEDDVKEPGPQREPAEVWADKMQGKE